MHVGGVRTALFAWLYARKNAGQFILRIEDTDKGREVEGSIAHIIESLDWLGIRWDEGPDIGGPHASYIQSERLPLYRRYAQMLIDKGHAYTDHSTPEQLDAMRAKAEAEKRPFLFRDHRPESAAERGGVADDSWYGTIPLRFRVPDIRRTTWHDLVRGELSAGPEALDDFILVKSDGYPTYNFAHIVDDIEMGISHVMRGEEFVSSTPKFLSLYEALGSTPPAFATLPPILGESGTKKLSKRDGAKDLMDYRAEGYAPEALVNYLALLGWNPGTEQEVFSSDELIAAFDIARVQKSGAMFDDEKLMHLNRLWLRSFTDDEYLARGGFPALDHDRLMKAVPLMKDRAQTFGEARGMLDGELRCLFERPSPDKQMLTKKETPDRIGATGDYLHDVSELIEALPPNPSIEDAKGRLMAYADAEEAKGKGGRGAVLWPLRYALSGQEKSPDPFTLISALGKDESVARINGALAAL